ncbi:MAG: hypothetical protein WBA13_14645 [Microcoleaceae cyanobacterium]
MVTVNVTEAGASALANLCKTHNPSTEPPQLSTYTLAQLTIDYILIISNCGQYPLLRRVWQVLKPIEAKSSARIRFNAYYQMI